MAFILALRQLNCKGHWMHKQEFSPCKIVHHFFRFQKLWYLFFFYMRVWCFFTFIYDGVIRWDVPFKMFNSLENDNTHTIEFVCYEICIFYISVSWLTKVDNTVSYRELESLEDLRRLAIEMNLWLLSDVFHLGTYLRFFWVTISVILVQVSE